MNNNTPFLPYGRQIIDDDDVAAVLSALRRPYLTTGPLVQEFEQAFAAANQVDHAVVVNSGTAALHAMYAAAGIGAGDEVIVPAITFSATAAAALYCGATPVFADVHADTLLLDPASVLARITPRSKAICAVDYAGQPADYAALRAIARQHGLWLFGDSCHAFGALYQGQPLAQQADAHSYSFHPVKHMTTAEGGAVVTNNTEWAEKMRRFRSHGMSVSVEERNKSGSWYYDISDLGYNYRLPDLLCALGLSQLTKLPGWVAQRRRLAAIYRDRLHGFSALTPLLELPDRTHSYHLFVVALSDALAPSERQRCYQELRQAGIGSNVHYRPVHLHSLYQQRLGTRPGLCPIAENMAERILSLPMAADMQASDIDRVVDCLKQIFQT